MIGRGLALLLVLLAGTAEAREPVSVDILQYGLFRSEIVAKQPDASGVVHNVVNKVCHLATTRVIPMRIGLQFGLRYRVTGPVAGERVLLKKVIRYPAIMAAPARPMSEVSSFVELPVGASSYTEYALEHPWELVAGIWTFQFFDQDRKVMEFSFTVSEGAAMPETGESTCFQLSS